MEPYGRTDMCAVLRPASSCIGPDEPACSHGTRSTFAQGRKGAGNTPDYSALTHAMTLRQVLRVRGRVPDPQGVPGPGRLDSLLQDHPLPHGWCCRPPARWPPAPSPKWRPHARPCSNHAPCGESQRRAAVLHVRSPGAIPRIYSGSARKDLLKAWSLPPCELQARLCAHAHDSCKARLSADRPRAHAAPARKELGEGSIGDDYQRAPCRGALFWCCAPVPCATQRLPPVTHKEGVPENKEKNHK